MRFYFLRFLLIAFGFFGGNILFAQYKIPTKPEILYPTYDEVGLLSEREKEALNQKLIKFEDSTSVEIEVVIIPTTKGEDVNFVATMFGEKWGIGKKETDNGVVFLIATEDRTMAIQQGRSVEQYLTATMAGEILDDIATPYFKEREFYQGIDASTDAIMDAVKGKYKPTPKEKNDFSIWELLLVIIIFVVIMIIIANDKNNHFDDDVILTRRGRRGGTNIFFGGGYSGGSGGSSFGGFGGGGSFGGGGASGSW